ncbi:MAG: hypothetical protein RLZZ156_1629 [Deinococcota bacterium]|jgi:hypothetical protein
MNLVCWNCGAKNESSNQICRICGKLLHTESQSQTVSYLGSNQPSFFEAFSAFIVALHSTFPIGTFVSVVMSIVLLFPIYFSIQTKNTLNQKDSLVEVIVKVNAIKRIASGKSGILHKIFFQDLSSLKFSEQYLNQEITNVNFYESEDKASNIEILLRNKIMLIAEGQDIRMYKANNGKYYFEIESELEIINNSLRLLIFWFIPMFLYAISLPFSLIFLFIRSKS